MTHLETPTVASPADLLAQPPEAVPMRWHLLVLACFAVIAVSCHIHRTGWAGAADALDGDLGNIATFAAGHDYPDRFAGDAVLGDARNFGWYATAHVPLARLLRPLGGGYGQVLLAGYGLHVFVHLLSFYLLGRALFRDPFWSAVLALLSLAPTPMGIPYDWWGLFDEPLPRLTYSALTGLLLAAAVRWRTSPRAWPWLMLASGASVYVHPVSAPAVGLALWLGLWSHRPAGWSGWGRVARMAGLGLLFLAPAVPFAVQYATGRQYRPSGDDALMREIYSYRFLAQTTDVFYAMRLAAKALVRQCVAPLGLVGAALLWRAGKWRSGQLPQFLLWLAGVAVVGVALPLLDFLLASRRGTVSMQVDLQRNVRFFVPIMLALFVWALAERDRRGQGRPAWVHAGLVAVTLWFAAHGGLEILERPLAAAQVLRTGQAPLPAAPPRAQAVAALRRLTPPEARVLPWNFPPAPIRHAALRSVVHSNQDGSCLVFARREAAVAWYAREQRQREIAKLPPGPPRLQAIVEWARGLGASHVLLNEPAPETLPEGVQSLWTDGTCSLLHVGAPASSRPTAQQ